MKEIAKQKPEGWKKKKKGESSKGHLMYIK